MFVQTTNPVLHRLLGPRFGLVARWGPIAKPAMHGIHNVLRFVRPAHGQNHPIGGVKTIFEIQNHLQGGFFDMSRFLANGRPAVGMNRVGQVPQFKPSIPVGLVEVALFEFFDHHALLGVQRVLIDDRMAHTIPFQP